MNAEATDFTLPMPVDRGLLASLHALIVTAYVEGWTFAAFQRAVSAAVAQAQGPVLEDEA